LLGNRAVTVLGKPATEVVPAKEGLMEKLKHASDRASFLLSIEQLKQKPGWAKRFEQSCYLIRYCSVFYISGSLNNL